MRSRARGKHPSPTLPRNTFSVVRPLPSFLILNTVPSPAIGPCEAKEDADVVPYRAPSGPSTRPAYGSAPRVVSPPNECSTVKSQPLFGEQRNTDPPR